MEHPFEQSSPEVCSPPAYVLNCTVWGWLLPAEGIRASLYGNIPKSFLWWR